MAGRGVEVIMRKAMEEAAGKRMPKRQKNHPIRSREGAAHVQKTRKTMTKVRRAEMRERVKVTARKSNTLAMNLVSSTVAVRVTSAEEKIMIVKTKTGTIRIETR